MDLSDQLRRNKLHFRACWVDFLKLIHVRYGPKHGNILDLASRFIPVDTLQVVGVSRMRVWWVQSF